MVLLTASEHRTTARNGRPLLACVLGFLSVGITLFITYFDLVLFFTQIQMKMTNGSILHDFLSKPIESIYISAYLFNITNAQEFMSGEDYKLKVEQVGPFTYKEVRYNEGLEIDEEAGVVRYTPRTEVTFMPEKSVGTPEDIYVTMPNLPMLGVASAVSSAPYWTRMGFNILVGQLGSKPIVTVSAKNYLWGYNDPLITLGHTLLPGFINIEKLGLLDRFYDKETSNQLVVGATSADKFMVKTRNGHKKLAMGKMENPNECEICNSFENSYEGIGYPAPVTKNTPVRMFRNGLCRILDMVYHKKVVLPGGVEALVFNLSDSFYSLDPNVTKNRILDLTDCYYGLPIGLTKVHFLDMEPEFYERIDGIKPDPTKNCYIVIETKIPLEMETNFPVQMNLIMRDVRYNEKTRPFANIVLPIGFVEITQPPLPENTKAALKLIYYISPILILTGQIALITIAITLISYSLLYCWFKKKGIMTHQVLTTGIKEKIVAKCQEPLIGTRQKV